MSNTSKFKVSKGIYNVTIATRTKRGYQTDCNTVAQDKDGKWYVCDFSYADGITNKVGNGFKLMRDCVKALQEAHSVKVSILEA